MKFGFLSRAAALAVVIAALGAGGWLVVNGPVKAQDGAAQLPRDAALEDELAILADRLGIEDSDALGEFVRIYLLANPEAIFEAAQRYETRQREAQQAAMEMAVRANLNAIIDDERAPAIGPDDAAVTIVEFFDYECSACHMANAVLQQVMAENPDIRYVFKEFPILSERSVEAARAALAAGEQGAYLAFHNRLMQHDGRIDDRVLVEAATALELDLAAFNEARRSGRYDAYLEDLRALARSLGIRGTPAFIIGDRVYPSALPKSVLDDAIAAARAAAVATDQEG